MKISSFPVSNELFDKSLNILMTCANPFRSRLKSGIQYLLALQFLRKLTEPSTSCIILLIGILFAVLPPSSIQACAVPVFKYALTYWAPDPYGVIVFHRGPLSTEQKLLVDRLQRASLGIDTRANVIVRMVNLAGSPDAEMQKLWEAQSGSEMPWMVLKYPRLSMISEDVWSGPLEGDAVEAILDSPVRKEIARHILEGKVAVWILLESGSKQQDDEAANLLETQLKKMSETLRISVPELGGDQFTESDLSVSFSVLRLSRSDPDEKILVQMLLKSEWDLKTFSKPIAFPVFGRGRALYALVGDGITESNIEMACAFLVGWCSCQVKAQNPGVDLLMSVDWDNMIGDELYSETTLLMESSEPAAIEVTRSNALRRNVLIVLLILILGVAVVTFVVLWRGKRSNRL